jgi:hypothetical protein
MTKDWFNGFSKMAIAAILCVSGAIAAEAEPQSTKKNQDLKTAANPAPVVKKVDDASANQARFLKLAPQDSSSQSIFLAQEISGDSFRKSLKIEPLPTAVAPKNVLYTTNFGMGIPTAFGANWGDAFIGASAATAGKARDQIDGSISTGFGLGNARDLVGLEVVYNLGSIRRFGANGTFDAKLHRVVYAEGSTQVAVAAGWNTFAQHGNEGVIPSGAYGVISSYSLLQPNDTYNKLPISFTVGAGGGNFRQGSASTGVFGGVGLQVHPQIALGAAWSGVGINLGVNYTPVPSIPLTIGLVGGDLSNNSPGGTVLILNVSYGFNFLPK